MWFVCANPRRRLPTMANVSSPAADIPEIESDEIVRCTQVSLLASYRATHQPTRGVRLSRE